jgi:hypothetical protein
VDAGMGDRDISEVAEFLRTLRDAASDSGAPDAPLSQP